MAIRHIESWSTSLYTDKALKFQAKLDGDGIDAGSPINEAIVRSVTRQAQDLADSYTKLDGSDQDMDPRPGHVLIANSSTINTPMLYNQSNACVERFEFDPETKTPKDLVITTETKDAYSHIQWQNGKLAQIDEFRSLNTTLLRDEEMHVVVDPKSGILNYQEKTHKRWI